MIEVCKICNSAIHPMALMLDLPSDITGLCTDCVAATDLLLERLNNLLKQMTLEEKEEVNSRYALLSRKAAM